VTSTEHRYRAQESAQSPDARQRQVREGFRAGKSVREGGNEQPGGRLKQGAPKTARGASKKTPRALNYHRGARRCVSGTADTALAAGDSADSGAAARLRGGGRHTDSKVA